MSWIGRTESHDSLYFRALPPCDELRRFIRYYWVLKCPPDAPFVEEYLAPDGFEEIIYSYGAAFLRTEVESNTRSSSALNGSYVVPCKTVGVSCSRLGPLNMVGVKLWPNSLHALLDHSMKDLKRSVLPLRDLGCLDRPDGMRNLGTDRILVVETGSDGTLSRIHLNGNKGRVDTVRRSFKQGAVAVTIVDKRAYVLGSRPRTEDGASGNSPRFEAIVVPLTSNP